MVCGKYCPSQSFPLLVHVIVACLCMMVRFNNNSQAEKCMLRMLCTLKNIFKRKKKKVCQLSKRYCTHVEFQWKRYFLLLYSV